MKIGTKWGYIDKTGKIVIEPKFEDASVYVNGVARVKIDGKLLYIDITGNESRADDFFYEGLAVFREGDKFGYVDRTGNAAIQPQFDEAESFSNGLAVVSFGEKKALINQKGKVIIDWPLNDASNTWIKRYPYHADEFYVFNVGGKLLYGETTAASGTS